MDLGIRGRAALVCASTSGLGHACARALAAEGVRVVVSGRRADLAERLAGELPGAHAVPVDLSRPGAGAELVTRAQEAVGDIDVVVLNSGGPPPMPAAGLDRAAVGAALDQLLLTQLDIVSLLLPGMRDRGWGRIVAIGSAGVVEPIPGLALSNLARAGLAGYLKTLAGEVASAGVTVNMVLPGRIATGRTVSLDESAAASAGIDVDQVRARSVANIPAGRYGDPDEYAAVVAFLCGEPAAYVTGTRLRVDGGMTRSH